MKSETDEVMRALLLVKDPDARDAARTLYTTLVVLQDHATPPEYRKLVDLVRQIALRKTWMIGVRRP